MEPRLGVAEHEVVLRDLRVGVPRFGQRGRAAREHGAVARRVGAGEEVEDDGGTVVVGQCADDEVKADVAGGDVVVARANVSDQPIEHGAPALDRHDESAQS